MAIRNYGMKLIMKFVCLFKIPIWDKIFQAMRFKNNHVYTLKKM